MAGTWDPEKWVRRVRSCRSGSFSAIVTPWHHKLQYGHFRSRSTGAEEACNIALVCMTMMVTIFSALEQTHCARLWFYSLRSLVILHKWLAFYSAFLNIHRSGVLTALAWLMPHETAAVSTQVLWTPYIHAPCHFMQNHIRKVYACLPVTCHLHFWQNDRGVFYVLLR